MAGKGESPTIRVAGWVSVSLVDVLGSPSFTIWFNYCNFRCPWCQNAHVVYATESREVSIPQLLNEIRRASILVDYVQATGGEPTLQPHGLKALFRRCRNEVGVKTSLSTNGSNCQVVKELLREGLLDHVALDVKAPLHDPRKYSAVIGLDERRGVNVLQRVRCSIRALMEANCPTEFRTTFVPNLLKKRDIIRIAQEIREESEKTGFCGFAYVIQQFLPSETLINPKFSEKERVPAGKIVEIAREVRREVGLENVYVRAQEIGTVRI